MLIKTKNDNDYRIAQLINRPAQIGHVGEFIASKIFDINLEESAVHKSIDGYFQRGPLIQRSVNIKWYTKQQAMLDITPESLPDYYLVLTGPVSPAISSRGSTRPWLIDHVYLFQASALVIKIRQRGAKIGIATSVPKLFWEEAEIYPEQTNPIFPLSDDTEKLLALFGSEEKL